MMLEAWHALSARLEPYLERVSVVVAYLVTLELWQISQLGAPYGDVGAKAAAGWLVLLCLPVWLFFCLIAIRSGHRLGAMWKWLA